MATAFEVRQLLEDGPEFPAQLAEWLEMELSSLSLLLDEMPIPVCQRCGRRFLPSASVRAAALRRVHGDAAPKGLAR